MKCDKSLREVWGWKDEIYKEIKNLSGKELVNYFRQQSDAMQKKYNLRLRKIRPSVSSTK